MRPGSVAGRPAEIAMVAAVAPALGDVAQLLGVACRQLGDVAPLPDVATRHLGDVAPPPGDA